MSNEWCNTFTLSTYFYYFIYCISSFIFSFFCHCSCMWISQVDVICLLLNCSRAKVHIPEQNTQTQEEKPLKYIAIHFCFLLCSIQISNTYMQTHKHARSTPHIHTYTAAPSFSIIHAHRRTNVPKMCMCTCEQQLSKYKWITVIHNTNDGICATFTFFVFLKLLNTIFCLTIIYKIKLKSETYKE